MRMKLILPVNRIISSLRVPALVLLVLMGAVVAGRLVLVQRIPFLILALLPFGMLGAYFALRYLRFGYVVLLIALSAGLAGPITLPTGTESPIPLSIIVTACVFFVALLRLITKQTRISSLRSTPIQIYILLFVGVNIISYVWGLIFRDPLLYIWDSFAVVQPAALFVNIVLPLVALLCLNTIQSLRGWYVLVWVTVLIGALGVASEIAPLPTYVLTRNGARGLFSVWAGGSCLALLLFCKNLRWPERALLFATIGGFVYHNVITNVLWLSAWVPMVFGWSILVLIRSRKLALLGVAVLAIFALLNFNFLYQEIVQANVDEGGTERFDIWAMNLVHVGNHPLFGMGPAGYAVYSATYHPEDVRSTHNNYFDVLAQNGIVGLLIFLAMMVQFLRMGWNNVRRTGVNNGFASALAAIGFAGTCAALGGMVLGDWVIPFAYNQTILGFDNAVVTWIFLGSIVSLDWLLRTQRVVLLNNEE